MSSGSHGDGAVSLWYPTEEATATKRLRLITSTGTLTSAPQLPTLPFELLEEFLCKLPVKLLLQLRCLCKSFSSLTSDPKFIKKHLQSSNHKHLIVSSTNDSREVIFIDSPISSIVSSTSRVTQTQLCFNLKKFGYDHNTILKVCSCDGILCIASHRHDLPLILWNPSIWKFKILPPLKKRVPYFIFRQHLDLYDSVYSFGYDPFIDNYKVIVVSSNNGTKKEVSVYTLGIDHWRRIDDFPFYGPIYGSGIFVSGHVNWLTSDVSIGKKIVSLNLEKESYKMLPRPDMNGCLWELGVFRDCLCISASYGLVLNVWIMKEYGKKESWTKLYSLPNQLLYPTKALYILEDDQIMLVDSFERDKKRKLIVYDYKNGIQKFQSITSWMKPNVYTESLISP